MLCYKQLNRVDHPAEMFINDSDIEKERKQAFNRVISWAVVYRWARVPTIKPDRLAALADEHVAVIFGASDEEIEAQLDEMYPMDVNQYGFSMYVKINDDYYVFERPCLRGNDIFDLEDEEITALLGFMDKYKTAYVFASDSESYRIGEYLKYNHVTCTLSIIKYNKKRSEAAKHAGKTKANRMLRGWKTFMYQLRESIAKDTALYHLGCKISWYHAERGLLYRTILAYVQMLGVNNYRTSRYVNLGDFLKTNAEAWPYLMAAARKGNPHDSSVVDDTRLLEWMADEMVRMGITFLREVPRKAKHETAEMPATEAEVVGT